MKTFTKTKNTKFTPEWINMEFLPYDEKFRTARKRARTKMDCCFKCDRRFREDEMMALASFGKKGNKVLCQRCAEYLAEGE